MTDFEIYKNQLSTIGDMTILGKIFLAPFVLVTATIAFVFIFIFFKDQP